MTLRGVLALAVAVCSPVAAALAGAAGPVHAATVRVSAVQSGTRIITVDGNPYTVKGYNYDPSFIGDQWLSNSWAIDEPTCKMDAKLLKGAGVNTLRIPYESWAPATVSLYNACLQDFSDNGIGVLWLIQAPNGTEEGVADLSPGVNPWVTAYEQEIQTAINDFGNNPATLFWTIGNEYTHTCANVSYDCWYGTSSVVGVADTLIAYAKSLDPNHLVGTSITSGAWQMSSANLPHLDFWGVNAYYETVNPGSSPDYFSQLTSADARPKIFTEWGTDRYTCHPGLLAVANVLASCAVPGSGEDQQTQANTMTMAWNNIAAHLATASNPSGAVSGGTAFMFADNWSYSVSTFEPSSPATHDVIGKANFYTLAGSNYYAAWNPDGYENAEWWGTTMAMWHGQNFPRATTLAFDALARLWSATAPPTMSGLGVSMNGCTPTVSWTTSEPASTEVQDAQEAVVLDGSGQMLQDNSIYLNAWNDTANLTTTHTATLTAHPVNGQWLRLIPRSTTSDGRTVTAAPIRVTC